MPLVVNSDRKTLSLYSIGCLIFVFISVMIYRDADYGIGNKIIAVLSALFFGIALIVYLLYMLPSSPLIIADENGIQFRVLLFSTGKIPWPYVLDFQIEKKNGYDFLVASLDPEWINQYSRWRQSVFFIVTLGRITRFSYYSVMLSESPVELLPKLKEIQYTCQKTPKEKSSKQIKQPYRNAFLGWLLIIFGSLLIVASIYWIVLRIVRWSVRWEQEKQLVRLMFMAGGFLIWIGQRLSSHSADQQLKTDTRAPVIYFRSFYQDDDDIQKRTMNFGFAETKEQSLAKLLSEFGPVIALGRPGDQLTVLGAYRKYVDDNQWQETVEEWLQNASMVILRLGCTENFYWELETAIRFVEPSKILIYYPQPLWKKERAEYRRVMEQVAFRFPRIKWPIEPENGQLYVLGNDLNVSCIPESSGFWEYIRGWARFNSDAPHLLAPLKYYAIRIGVSPPKLPIAPYEYLTIPGVILMLFFVAFALFAFVWLLFFGK